MPSPDTLRRATTASRPRIARIPLPAAVAAGLFFCAAAEATPIVDTVVVAPLLAGANSIDATDWMAESFSIASAATIDSVAVQALDASPGTEAGLTFQVAIYAGRGGLPALDFNAANQGRLYAANVTYAADGWNGATGLQWQIAPGTYWLAVEAGNDATAVTSLVLPTGAQGAIGGIAFYSGSSSYAATGKSDAFGLRVNAVSAVPEPASFAMLLVGLGALAVGRRGWRRH